MLIFIVLPKNDVGTVLAICDKQMVTDFSIVLEMSETFRIYLPTYLMNFVRKSEQNKQIIITRTALKLLVDTQQQRLASLHAMKQ